MLTPVICGLLRLALVGEAFLMSIEDMLRVPIALGAPAFLDDLRAAMRQAGVIQAIAHRDTAAIFDWMIGIVQLQGVSDHSAISYSDRHGLPTFRQLDLELDGAECPRLASYWHFSECGYLRAACTCANPERLSACPLPNWPARNGRLSQAAASLFMFFRDVADGDIVGWLDGHLSASGYQSAKEARDAVLAPLCQVHGVSAKVMSMALADLLLAGDPDRSSWVSAGVSMVAIDTLVHNYLHRTGACRTFGVKHGYGPACYGPGGCAELIERAAERFDARSVNPAFPAHFPRFVQHAVWTFCASDRLNICNGNAIDDRIGCRQMHCPAGDGCQRLPLSQ